MPIADCGHEVEIFYEDGVAFQPIRCDPCLLEFARRAKQRGDDLRLMLALGRENYVETQEAIIDARNELEAGGQRD